MDLQHETATEVSDNLMDTYNEWRRHITARLENEPDAYSTSPVTLLLGKKNMYFDAEKNMILMDDGTEIHYDKCLIASAGKPRNFYVLDGNKISYSLRDRINTCTSLSDFEKLSMLHMDSSLMNVTVVGGGFLGTEVTAALASRPENRDHGVKVQQIYVESSPCSRYLPPYLSAELERRLKALGNVELINDRLVTAMKPIDAPRDDDDHHDIDAIGVSVSLLGDKKEKLATDYVALCSTHIDPNVRLARDSNLEVDKKRGGIVTNAQLEASSGIYVAGNAASYYDVQLGRRRVDMYDHAVNSGLVAGQNMVASRQGPGKARNYTHQPMFRSSMPGIDVLVEGMGEVDSNLETVSVWLDKKGDGDDHKYERGVVYYVKGNKIVGIVLWNAPDLVEAARQILNFQPNVDHDRNQLKQTISLGPDNWLRVAEHKHK